MRELVVCLVLFAATVLAFLHFYADDPEEDKSRISEQSKPRIFERNIVRRNVTPDTVLPAPNVAGEQVERLPAIEPPPPPPRPPEPTIWENPIVVAAGIMRSGDNTIILADIYPIPLEKKCDTDAGGTWPCGMFARTDMRQFVRGRSIACNPVEQAKDEAVISTRCTLANFDMSAWLVLTGWATPKNGAFQTELEEAREKQRGQWRRTVP